MKILPKFGRSVSRYINKNTVNGRYNRHMDAACLSGIAAVTHGITTATIPGLTHCEPANLAINLGLWGVYVKNFGEAIIDRIKLRPIIKRAKAIKKATKNINS